MDNKIDMKLLKKILFNSKKQFLWKYVTSTLIRVSLLTLPIFYSYAIDNVSNNNFELAFLMIGISLIVTLIFRIAEHYNQVTFHMLYRQIYKQYTNLALLKTNQNSLYSLSRISLGEFTNILNTDIDIISTFWSNGVMRSIQMLEFIFIFLALFFINIFIGGLAVVFSIVAFLILFLYGKKIAILNNDRKEKLDKKTSILHELFLGIKEIKGLNIFPFVNKRVSKSTDVYLDSHAAYNIKYNKNKTFVLFLMEFFRLVLFAYGVYLIMKGQMELGALLIIYNYFTKLTENINELGVINMEFRNLKVSILRFQKILQYSRYVDKEGKVINEPEGKVEFKNVLYGDRENPILNDVSFLVDANTITVLDGKSGNDKEGVFDLLLRLNRQHEGTISIDGTNIQDYNDDFYSELVLSVRDQPVFLKMTIRENLEMITKDFPKVIRICKRLGIHDEIVALKKGYDTLMNDGANPISDNLVKMLGIARLLLKNPKVMLFSDIFAGLDSDTKSNLIKILLSLKKEHTIIVITKDQEFIKISDQVIEINDGKIV